MLLELGASAASDVAARRAEQVLELADDAVNNMSHDDDEICAHNGAVG